MLYSAGMFYVYKMLVQLDFMSPYLVSQCWSNIEGHSKFRHSKLLQFQNFTQLIKIFFLNFEFFSLVGGPEKFKTFLRFWVFICFKVLINGLGIAILQLMFCFMHACVQWRVIQKLQNTECTNTFSGASHAKWLSYYYLKPCQEIA